MVSEITCLIFELLRFTNRTESSVIYAFDDRCAGGHTLVIIETRLHRYGFVGFLFRSWAGFATAVEQIRQSRYYKVSFDLLQEKNELFTLI